MLFPLVLKNVSQYREKEVTKMDEQRLINQIEEKREALKKLLRSKDFNLKDPEVIKLSQELDELIFQYAKQKAQE